MAFLNILFHIPKSPNLPDKRNEQKYYIQPENISRVVTITTIFFFLKLHKGKHYFPTNKTFPSKKIPPIPYSPPLTQYKHTILCTNIKKADCSRMSNNQPFCRCMVKILNFIRIINLSLRLGILLR